MRTTLALLALAAGVSSALAEPVTVNYRMAIAGLPIGSATLALTPKGTPPPSPSPAAPAGRSISAA